MKQLLFFIVLSCWINSSTSQSTELLGTWYLNHILLGDVGIHPEAGTSPFILFEDSNATYQISGSGGCNDFTGTVDYDVNDENYLINSFVASSNWCSSNVNQFEDVFFNFFMEIGQTYSYHVFIDSGGAEVLVIEFFPVGDTVEFRRTQPLAVESFKAATLELAPNPVKDLLFISSEMSQIGGLSVYDIRGSLVIDVTAFDGELDISALKSGCYFLEIHAAAGRVTKKFVKE